LRTLVLGGMRSGKSAYAEQLAMASGKELIYIATGQAFDDEMVARIALHRQRRDGNPPWITVEQPLALGDALAQWCAPQRLVLVDCLTIWLSNLLFSAQRDGADFPETGRLQPPACFAQQRSRFLSALDEAAGDVILVSGEVGMGVVPQGAVSRWFVDAAGSLNQAVAAACERAVLVVAGLPVTLKG
jgi:adenosylcobinamide kinase/adenosylcobinamide-phosphate guanylyltransferase